MIFRPPIQQCPPGEQRERRGTRHPKGAEGAPAWTASPTESQTPHTPSPNP